MPVIALITLSHLLLNSNASVKHEPTNQEILQTNTYPKWFTEGKLGIWAHWGPQSVPMEGDWYARNLYIQGSHQYEDHLSRYGHPSVKGYKDIIPLWTAEKWDPDRLMAMYKKAGAKYFVSMGCHHDNFDLWNSKFHRWNAVNMGPHKDVVGTWQKAAKKLGLHFGVSEHMGASFTWFQVSRGSDKTGPQAGVPYDGNDPAYEDLYHAKTLPGDNGWLTNNPVFQHEWSQRITDLIDNYHPDLLYSDSGFPFGAVGEGVVAHFYQQSRDAHHGQQEVIYTCKQPSEGKWTQDLERGVQGKIQPYPWQTDTSIGDWFYNKNWKYRGADWVLHTLIDVVSKNGNLLINVVQRPDGSLDKEAEQVLVDMADWMKTNSESIYNTTPWIVFGEGPVRAKGGSFKEDFAFTEQDIRFAAKGNNTLYATAMGKITPGEHVLKTLVVDPLSPAKITSVKLLGAPPVKWNWKPDGLHIMVPEGDYSPIASVFKINGGGMRQFNLPQPEVSVIKAGGNGVYDLDASLATLSDRGINTETTDGKDNIGYWDSPQDTAAWTISVPATGDYVITAITATPFEGAILKLSVGDQSSLIHVDSTGSFDKYTNLPGGSIHLTKGDKVKVTASPGETWHPINLRKIYLQPRLAQ